MQSIVIRWWICVVSFAAALGVAGAEKTLVIGGVPVTLQDLTGEVEVYYSGMRYNRVQNLWNFEATVKNSGIRELTGPFVLYVESFSGSAGVVNADGMDGTHAYYDLELSIPNGLLAAGQQSTPRTLTMSYTAGAQPKLNCKVYGHPQVGGFALATTRTLNELGQPLGDVLVEETGPAGAAVRNSESAIGVVTLGQGTGGHLWKFSKPGYLPVWRLQTLSSNRVATLPAPKLTPISTNVVSITPIAGGKMSAKGIEVSFGPGAFNQETLGTVTPLTGQTLPALLPLGWSPVQGFALGLGTDANAEANLPGTVALTPWSRVLGTEVAAFVRWDESSLKWQVQEVVAGGTNLTYTVQRSGAYAVVVADSGALSPAPAVAGQELSGVDAPVVTSLSAIGTVTPSLSPANTNPDLVTASAEVVFTSASGALPSGTLLRTEVSETYDLVDDVRQVLPKYESFIVGYQRPSDGIGSTLIAQFPLRPVLLYSGSELKQANIQVDVLPPADFKGGVFNEAGGQVSEGPVRVVAAAGTFTNAYTVDLRLVNATNFLTLVPSNTVVAAFDLSFPALPNGKRLVAQFAPQQANSFYVLGRVVGRDGWHGVEPVERFASDAAGRLASLEPASGERLPGIVSAGQFVLIKMAGPQGIVSGVTRNAANVATAGLPVWIVNQPWMTFSGSGGAYRLVASEGSSQIGVADLGTGDRTIASVTVANWQNVTVKNVAAVASGPKVVLVSPSSGATNVALVSGVTLKFSEPLNLGTVVPDGIVLLGRSNQPVVATLGFNLSGDTATLLPAESLLADTVHTIVLSTNIADRTGLKLVGESIFTFRTRTDVLERGAGAQIISYEPTNGVVKMHGTQGIADPNKPVILVNDTTGHTTTIISKADGSFDGDLIATEEDFLSAVFVNVNGTTNMIPVSRQVFADGRVGLFRGGGVLEAEGENGAIQLIVEPGSVPSKTVLSLSPVALTNLPAAVKNTPPAPEEGAKVLGGFKVSVSGDLPTQSMDVVFPVKPETLGLPQGVHPTNATFALAIPRQHQDPETGEFMTIYEVVDRMQWEDGKLVTHSPPFFGLLGMFEDLLVTPLLMTVGSSMTISGKVLAAETYNTGRPIPGTEKYLPGAFVTAIPPNIALPGVPGRIRPGAIFATAGGTNAGFAFLVPVDRGGSVTIRAVHPKFPNQDALAYVPALTMSERFAIGNQFSPVDVVFPLQNWRDDEPPYISLSHTPDSPQPTNSALVRVVTTDNASRPSSTITLDSARTLIGNTNILDDVSMYITNREEVGAFGRREFAVVSSPLPSVVQLRISASDDSGNRRETMYPIVFGAAELVLTNTIPPADTNDVTGPFVVSSYPSRGSRAFNPGGEPIVLKFDEPIDRSILSNAPTVFAMMPGNLRPVLQLSEDQLQLSLYFYELKPNTTYTLTVNSGLKDISGNGLDQDKTEDGDNAYTLTFTTAELRESVLPEMQNGGGVVVRGIYAYALERSMPLGKVNIYDLSNPTAPQKVAQYTTQPFPRDLVLIPQYSFKKSTNEVTHHTKDLLAVVGGALGLGNRPWLRLLDISNPLDPELLVGVALSGNPEVAVGRVQWAAPTLAYMENGAVSAVSIVDLQTLILSEFLTPAQWSMLPRFGEPGIDANNDGDYVDAGDTMPVPAREPIDFSGKLFTYGLGDTDQWIRDFVLSDQGAFIGVITDEGHVLGPDGLPTNIVAQASYRTLVDGTVLEREPATFIFTNALPRRVSFLPQFPMVVNSDITRMDLALVSVRMKTGHTSEGENWLYVLNVTDANDPHLLTRIPMPPTADEGSWSAVLRDDGLIALATDKDILLLDPTKLRMAMVAGGVHPAIVGIIPHAGDATFSFASSISGLNVLSSGGRNVFVQTAPSIQVVNFATNAPFNPEELVDSAPTNIANAINHFMLPGAIMPARFRTETNVVESTLTPPQAEAHYFVLVRAPGSAGETIDLAVESLNWAGQPLRKRGFLFAPVHAVSSETVTKLDQVPSAEDAPVRALKAWRLSSNPASEFYNVYLSRAFALTYEEMSKAEIAALQAEVDREIIWGGDFLRVSLDPVLRGNDVLKAFVGDVDQQTRIHEPGVEVVLPAFRAEFIQGPNPGPIYGGVQVAAALNAINPHSGEMVMGATDMTLPGRKLPIEFRRTSASQALFDGPFGRGWDFNFNQRVVELKDYLFPQNKKLPLTMRSENEAENDYAQVKDILFYTGAGRVVAYKFAGTNAPSEVASDPLVLSLGWTNKVARYYLPPAGLFNLFFKFKDGRYARLEADGKQYWYNAAGQLTKIYDRYEKNSLEMVYNGRGELIRILDEVRRPLEIGYYRLVNDPERRSLIDRTTTRSAIAGKIARLLDYSKRDILYHYTDEGLLEKREGPLVETTVANGFTGRQLTTYIYSDASNPTKSGKVLVGVIGGDNNGTPLMNATELGERGRDTVSKLKLAGREITVNLSHQNNARALGSGTAKTVVTAADGSISDYRFDTHGRPLEILTTGTGTNATLVLTNKTEYYTNGLVKRIIKPEGNSVEYYYDSTNVNLRSRANLVRIVKNPGPRGGAVLEATSQFDSWYNLPAGIKTDYNGNEATIVLTPDHRETERVTKEGKVETYVVNEFGMIESHTAIDGIVRGQTYTPEGFIHTKSVGPLTTTYSYAPNSGVTSDQTLRGLASQVIDPEGIPTDFVYDERNQLVKQTRAGMEVTHAYNAQGDEVETRTTVDTGRVVIETKDYNQLGFMERRAIKEVETDGQVRDLVTTYVPDSLNRVKEMIAPGGDRHLVSYDTQGRTLSYEIEGAYKESYGYDKNGNQISKTIGTAIERYTFDGHDRMVKVQTPTGAEVRVALDGNDNLTNKLVVDASGEFLSESSYVVDAFNRYTKVERRHEDGVSTMKYDYIPEQRKIVMTDALGAVSTVFYDTAGREFRTETPTKTNVKFYDDNNNIIRRESHENGRVYVDRYEYNSLNQLTNIIDNAGNESAIVVGIDGRVKTTIDRQGNRQTNEYTLLGELANDLTANAVATKYRYDTNRNISQIADTGNRATKQIYAPQGQLLTTILPHQERISYTNFTALMQPRHIEMPRGISVDVSYDPEGRMTNRVLSGFGPSRTERYAFDGMQRPTLLQDPNSTVEFDYDRFEVTREFKHSYTFLQNPPTTANLQFSVKQTADKAGNRSALIYPTDSLTVTNRRDITGRLEALIPNNGEAILSATEYAGDRLIGTRTFGNNRIVQESAFDALKRTTSRRYVRNSDGKALVDLRYQYDKSGAQSVRQYAHRGGRADFYKYDAGYRLRRVDAGVRPRLTATENARAILGFAVPSGVAGDWLPGFYAREFNYNDADLFTTTTTLNPDGLAVSPMAANFGEVDELLHVGSLDGFTRTRDEVGNVTRTMLAVRGPGSAATQLVPASLSYNALGQLVQVTRDDGVQIVNEYNVLGMRIRRQVTGPAGLCVASDLAFIYDGSNLIEIRDLTDGGELVARYFYTDDGDELIAGDVAVGGGALERKYFLSDTLRSVLAVTDATGSVIERVNYDAWGQPTFQLNDAAAPTVSRVTLDGTSLLVEFTEAVLPTSTTTQTTNIITTLRSLANVFTVRAGGQTINTQIRFEENLAGAAFGSVFRITPGIALSGAVELNVTSGTLADEWGNPNGGQTLNLTINGSTTLFTGPARGSSAPVELARSSIESPFLFHGQFFDYESGLLYCRARFYDPYAGLFIQRDPAGYVDGVNQYAGFANNPVNLRDPSGMSVDEWGRELSLIGSQASYKEDGILGAAVGSVLEGVGAVLQLGTSWAEGTDLLETSKPGTWGLLDAMKGAELLTADLKTAFGSGLSMYGMVRSMAGSIEGYVLRKQTKHLGMPLHKRVLYSKGWHGVEPDAIVKTMKEMNVTELSVREFGQKAAGRKIAGDLGYSKKPGFVATKTSGPLSTVTHQHWDVHSANIWEKTYTGDLDLFSMKINGRRATPAEVNRFITRANINYARMWKKAGNVGVPNVPFRHGAHFHLADMYGKSSGGKVVDNKLIKAIGHPGDTVSIRIDGFGRVSAYSTPRSQITAEIAESELILKALQKEDYGLRGGFPKNWHEWPN